MSEILPVVNSVPLTLGAVYVRVVAVVKPESWKATCFVASPSSWIRKSVSKELIVFVLPIVLFVSVSVPASVAKSLSVNAVLNCAVVPVIPTIDV